jgi:hypothetical protein
MGSGGRRGGQVAWILCAVVGLMLVGESAADARSRADRIRPSLTIRTPQQGVWVSSSPVAVAGTASDRSGIARVTCNGRRVRINHGRVLCRVSLRPGVNTIRVRASDRAGNARVVTRRVNFRHGVLAGPAGARVLKIVGDFDGHDPGVGARQISADGTGPSVARTRLQIAFSAGATVAQVDTLLTSVNARIVSSLARVAVLEVEIPDPHTISALHRIIASLRRSRSVRYVTEAVMPRADALPQGVTTSSSDLQKVANSLAVRAPAAWNARGVIHTANRPTVVVGDFFGADVPDGALDVEGLTKAMFGKGGDTHGYSVAGVIAGRFGDDATPRGLVTGVFPAKTRMSVVDIFGSAGIRPVPEFDQDLIRAIRQAAGVGGNVILNTSLSDCNGSGGCPTGDQLAGVARAWIEDVRGTASAGHVGAGLENRFLQTTTAGNIEPGGPTDSQSNSEYNAAHLLPGLTEPDGTPLPDLTNVVVVQGDYAEDPAASPPGIDCLDATSKRPGDISAVGDVGALGGVWTLTGPKAGAGFAAGTSFASPQVAGLAEYVWTLEPKLAPRQLAALLKDTAQRPLAVLSADPGCDQNLTPAAAIDAYSALLSLDTTQLPIVGDQPTREALLNSDVNEAKPGFTEEDLADFLFQYFDAAGAAVSPPSRDYGRWDLNGDGFTGGTTTARFDLDRTGSTLWGKSSFSTVTQDVLGVQVAYDETAVSDLDILCYYAYSPLYVGDHAFRDQQLGPHCLPKVDLTANFPSTAVPGTPSPLAVSVQRPDFPAQGQSAPQPGVRIELSPTGGSVDSATGTTGSLGNFNTNATLVSPATTITITITARAGAGGPVLGQTTVQASSGRIGNIDVLPGDTSCSATAGATDVNFPDKPEHPSADTSADNNAAFSFSAGDQDTFQAADGTSQVASGAGAADCSSALVTVGTQISYLLHCSASGNSSISGDSVFAHGVGSGEAAPHFTVRNRSVTYELSGTLSGAGPMGSSTQVAKAQLFHLPDLAPVTPDYISAPAGGDIPVPGDQNGTGTIATPGTLAPGEYQLAASCVAGSGSLWPDAPSGSGSAGYDLTLSLTP